jgi:hypothetical protein
VEPMCGNGGKSNNYDVEVLPEKYSVDLKKKVIIKG